MSFQRNARDRTTYRDVYAKGRYDDEPTLGRYEARANNRRAYSKSRSKPPPYSDDRRYQPRFDEWSRDDERDYPLRSPHYDDYDGTFSSPIPQGPRLDNQVIPRGPKSNSKKKKANLIDRTDVHSSPLDHHQKEDSTVQSRQISIAGSVQQSEMSPSSVPLAKKRKLESSKGSESSSAIPTPHGAPESIPAVPKRAKTQPLTEVLPISATTTLIDSTRDPRSRAKSVTKITVSPMKLKGRSLDSASTSSKITSLAVDANEGGSESPPVSAKDSPSSAISEQQPIGSDIRSTDPASVTNTNDSVAPSKQRVQSIQPPAIANTSNQTTPSEGTKPAAASTAKDQPTINALFRDILNRNADITISKWKRDAHRESTQSNKDLLRSVEDLPDVREDLLMTLRTLEADANATEGSLNADLVMKRTQINDSIKQLVKAVWRSNPRNDSPNVDVIRAELKQFDTKIRDEMVRRQDEMMLRVKANEDLMLAPFGSIENYTTDLTRLLSKASSRSDTEHEHVEMTGPKHNSLSWRISSQDMQIAGLRESIKRLEGVDQSLDLSRKETEVYKNQVTALSKDFIKFREELTAEKAKSLNLATAVVDMVNNCQMLATDLDAIKAKLKVNEDLVLQLQAQRVLDSQTVQADKAGSAPAIESMNERDEDRDSQIQAEVTNLKQSLRTAGDHIEDLNERVQKIESQEKPPSVLDQAEIDLIKSEQKTTSESVNALWNEQVERDEMNLKEEKATSNRFEQILGSIWTIEAVIGRYFPANTKSIAVLQEEYRSLANNAQALTTDAEDRFRLINNNLDHGNSSVEGLRISVNSIDEQLKALQSATSERSASTLDEHKLSALSAAVSNLNARFNSLSTENLANSIVGQMSKIYPHASSLQRSFDVQNMRISEIANQTQKYLGDELAKLSGPLRNISGLQTRLENAERVSRSTETSSNSMSSLLWNPCVNGNGSMAPPSAAVQLSKKNSPALQHNAKQDYEALLADARTARKDIDANFEVRLKMQSDIAVMQQEIKVIQASLGQSLPQSPPNHSVVMSGERSVQQPDISVASATSNLVNGLGISVLANGAPSSNEAATTNLRPNLEYRRSSSGFTAVNSS